MNTRWLSRPADYERVWRDMQQFTAARTADTPDEIWLCEHAPVYTLGQAGRAEHVLDTGGIPLVQCDRGGQVTYHGPGQAVAYALLDLRRAGLFVKEYVTLLEEAALATLRDVGVADACRRPGAPGIYVPEPMPERPATRSGVTPALQAVVGSDTAVSAGRNGAGAMAAAAPSLAKIAALGVKIRNGRAYHGLALNVAMDLDPFLGIDPCGYAGLRTVDLATLGIAADLVAVGELMAGHVDRLLAAHRETPARREREVRQNEAVSAGDCAGAVPAAIVDSPDQASMPGPSPLH